LVRDLEHGGRFLVPQKKDTSVHSFRRPLCAALAGALGAFALATTGPAAHAETGAAVRITEFAYGGKIATGGDGEYIELTNTGTGSQDMTGWSYNNVATVGGTSLSGLGTLAPGESAILTDADPAAFRADWGLKDSVKVIDDGSASLNKGPSGVHIFDADNAEVDSVTYAQGFFPGKGASAWVDAAHLGAKSDTTGWTLSTADDGEGSWTSASGSVGSPGASTLGSLTPADVRTGTETGGGPEAPCDTEDAGSDPGTIPPGALAWPGSDSPTTIDDQCAWVTSLSGQDLSGLAFDPKNADVLYAVKNKSHVYRLVRTAGGWSKDTANGWAEGKDIRFPGGTGLPDSEGLAVGPDGALYITTERDNAASGVPLDSILKFDPTSSATTLVASDQWVLTDDLGFTNADANLGFEGVAYVPDSFLISVGFRTDDGTVYDPAKYPSKVTGGVFFAAVEKTGHLRAYVLDADHSHVRIADIDTGMAGVMDASFDPDLGRIWAHCDNTCGNATALLKVGADGHFAVERYYDRPANLPNYNLEGFAVAPYSTASNGSREVLWTDDGDRFGHSLWSGTISTTPGLPTISLTSHVPTLSGTAKVGRRLTAHFASWGPGTVKLARVWLANGQPIKGATGDSLRLTAALRGKAISLRVTGTETGYITATVQSRATATVKAGTITAKRPRIRGVVRVGKRLVARHGAWYADGSRIAFRYRWYVNGKLIRGATKAHLKLVHAYRGKRIKVTVVGRAVGYASATRTSAPTRKVRGEGRGEGAG